MYSAGVDPRILSNEMPGSSPGNTQTMEEGLFNISQCSWVSCKAQWGSAYAKNEINLELTCFMYIIIYDLNSYQYNYCFNKILQKNNEFCLMCASILKRTCNALLITIMLTSSLIKQGFAMEARVGGVQRQNPVASKANLSPAVQNLKTKLTRRTNAYNAQSEQPSIPRDTSEINRIYQSAPSDRHANDDEREALIKGLMFTAGIHGTAMPLNLQQSSKGSTLTALQKHYAIIHALDVLSRDYFVNDIFSSQEDQYVLLQNYAGLGKGTINEWLGYTRGELTGLTKPNGKY